MSNLKKILHCTGVLVIESHVHCLLICVICCISHYIHAKDSLRPCMSRIWAVLHIRKYLAYSHLSLSILKCILYLIYFMIWVLHVFLFHMIFISNLCSFYLFIDWLMFKMIQKDTSVANESCCMAASILYNITRGCGSCINNLKPYWLIDTADKVFASLVWNVCSNVQCQTVSICRKTCQSVSDIVRLFWLSG